MKVKEIMVRDIISLSPDMSAKEGLSKLFTLEISGLPVVDASGKLAGMFTEKDVLRTVLPGYVDKVGGFIYEENPKIVKKKMSGLSDIKVSDIMRKEVVTTSEDTGLCEIARIMLTQKARRVLVVDESGKILGIVARGDVLRALASEAGHAI